MVTKRNNHVAFAFALCVCAWDKKETHPGVIIRIFYNNGSLPLATQGNFAEKNALGSFQYHAVLFLEVSLVVLAVCQD